MFRSFYAKFISMLDLHMHVTINSLKKYKKNLLCMSQKKYICIVVITISKPQNEFDKHEINTGFDTLLQGVFRV
jgi:hypothetical protein